jgi:hypothetical protein
VAGGNTAPGSTESGNTASGAQHDPGMEQYEHWQADARRRLDERKRSGRGPEEENG